MTLRIILDPFLIVVCTFILLYSVRQIVGRASNVWNRLTWSYVVKNTQESSAFKDDTALTKRVFATLALIKGAFIWLGILLINLTVVYIMSMVIGDTLADFVYGYATWLL